MVYLKLFWKHNLENEPVVILYEIDENNERLAIRSIDVFADRNTVNIDDLYANAIEILPVPTAEAFNSHELGNEFYACLISKEEFEQTWNVHHHYGKLDE